MAARFLMSDVTLYNIDRNAEYQLSVTGESYDEGLRQTVRGTQLMKPEIIIREKPGSALLRYRRVANRAARD